MKLAHDWKAILVRAWSIRWIVAGALFSGLEIALPLFHDAFPLDRGVFAALSFVCTAAAFVARIVAQRQPADTDEHDGAGA